MPDRHHSLAAFARQKTSAAIPQRLCSRRRKRIEAQMTCEEAQELITAWVDGELLDPERSSLGTHLVECVGCQRTLEEERALKQAIRGYRERIHAPDELRRRIVSDQRIFSEQKPSPHGWRDYIRTLPLPVSAALAAVLLLAIALPPFVLLKSSS